MLCVAAWGLNGIAETGVPFDFPFSSVGLPVGPPEPQAKQQDNHNDQDVASETESAEE